MTAAPWRDAWHEALYGADGFYRRHRPAEHFATAVHGIPHAVSLLAAALVAIAHREQLTAIVDVGAGGGHLLREISAADPGLALTGVEVRGRPADLPEHVEWVGSPGGGRLPDDLRGLERTLLLAHEWLDDVPCPIAQFDGSVWRQVLVRADGGERLGDPVGGPDGDWITAFGPVVPSAGDRSEVGITRDLAYADLVSRLRGGLVVAVDYGYRCGGGPPAGTLTGYRNGRVCAPRPDGSCNLTAHVCVDSLGADQLESQRGLLAEVGIAPPAAPIGLAHTDPAGYLTRIAERSAWAALRMRGGLGDFFWAMTPVGGGSALHGPQGL